MYVVSTGPHQDFSLASSNLLKMIKLYVLYLCACMHVCMYETNLCLMQYADS